MSENIINFTEEEFNSLPSTRIIAAFGDGQGDTYLESFEEILDYYEEEATNLEVMDNLYQEYRGNMVKIKILHENTMADFMLV
jgi:hypothetical protein